MPQMGLTAGAPHCRAPLPTLLPLPSQDSNPCWQLYLPLSLWPLPMFPQLLTCAPVPLHHGHSGSPGYAAHVGHALARDLLLASYLPGPGSEMGRVSSCWGSVWGIYEEGSLGDMLQTPTSPSRKQASPINDHSPT